MTGGASALPDEIRSALPPAAGIGPLTPSDEVVALADEAHLSDDGRKLFYGAKPEILGAQGFAGRCVDGQAAEAVPAGALHPDGAVACYLEGPNSIVLYAPADPRLRGTVVESAAHETLHAAWAHLSADTQTQLGALLEAEVAALPADDGMHAQIAGSVGSHPQNRSTEIFAYVGTQVWRGGGLAPQLEAAYSHVIADRAALVAVHTGQEDLLTGMASNIEAASHASAARSAANAQDRAQYEATMASVQIYRQSYEDQVSKVLAMSPEQRRRTRLSWVWWDGTPLPMAPAEVTLSGAAALLARDDADLPGRGAAITAAEVAVAGEAARVDGLVAELRALQAQLDPAAAL